MNEAETNPNMENKCPQCGAPLPSGVLAGFCPACLMKQGATADTAVPPDTASFQPPSVEEIAKLFPQLEIIALIGKGGMGAVYRARQPALDRIVALKILPPQTAGGPGFVERFNREARALAKLNHPNIVGVYEFGQVNGLPFFIMEFVDGLNLRQLERAGKLSPREALQIVPQICEALQFAHDEGIVHRDIKPENILLDKKGRVKIADFGIAKILGNAGEVDLTGTQGAIGTPHYMAPEQMEKPTTVDHRADIFSLGVVFYEMLTGELPLGKFAPPSSRKVEVDVRLDDVVLRTLEKDPERRYQHASQVKTAVDTIADSAAPPPSATDAEALAQAILARDYNLNIRSCLRRGWKLLTGEFWPFVGITALLFALLGFASTIGGTSIRFGPTGDNSAEMTSVFAMLVWGPLMGGLLFYFLKKIRREPATVETAFCGFSHRFLHLFLAGFVTSLLTWLGFLCLILPGIYLLVAWMFTLPLVMDKQLDFWSAMELSRKVVTKHWFKFFGFGIVMLLLTFAGVFALVIGVFVMSPLILAALMYAYEDIFGGHTQTAVPPLAGVGSSGTVVMPEPSSKPPRSKSGAWTPATKIGLAAVVLVIGVSLLLPLNGRHSLFSMLAHSLINNRAEPQSSGQDRAIASESTPLAAPVESAEPIAQIPPAVFGPVIERVVTNSLNLGTGELGGIPWFDGTQIGLSQDIGVLDQKVELLRLFTVDVFTDNAKVLFGIDLKTITVDSNVWEEEVPPAKLADNLDLSDRNELHALTPVSGIPNPPFTCLFETRNGLKGILQITGFIENPRGVNIRYKLVQSVINPVGGAGGSNRDWAATLAARLEAASNITEIREKDKSLAAIASSAAKLGQAKIVGQALSQMVKFAARSAAARQAALLLAKSGFRKEAVEMAKDIGENSIRDQTLSELAQ